MKYPVNFKKIVLRCVSNGWLPRDPFGDFSLARKEVVRDALTEIEFQAIASKKFGVERLNYVRDIFLFSCYTGLAYIDVKKLKRSEIMAGIEASIMLYAQTLWFTFLAVTVHTHKEFCRQSSAGQTI